MAFTQFENATCCVPQQTDTSRIEATFAFDSGAYATSNFRDVGFVRTNIHHWLVDLVCNRTVPAMLRMPRVPKFHVSNKNCDMFDLIKVGHKHYLFVRGDINEHKNAQRYFCFATCKPKEGNRLQCLVLLDIEGNCNHTITSEVLSVAPICKNIHCVKTLNSTYYVMVRNLAE